MARIGVAVLHNSLGRSGGIDIYAWQLVEALADYTVGHRYVVLVGPDSPDWTHRVWPAHVEFAAIQSVAPAMALPIRAWHRARLAAGFSVPPHFGDAYVAYQMDRLGLDLIHFPSTTISPLSIQTPSVLTFFDMQQEYYPEFFTRGELQERSRTYRPSVEKASRIIVPSDYTRRTLVEKYRVPEERMVTIPVGKTRNIRIASPAQIAAVRAKYGLPGRYLYYPANPWQHKNHARLFAALRIYHDTYGPPPTLVLSGRLFDERRDAMSLAIAAGIEELVVDLGYVPVEDMSGLYAGAHLMVFPSLYEGFGLPVLEAMACGCAVAAANATALPELVDGAALLFDPSDPGEIAQAIHCVVNDDDLRLALIQRGITQARNYDWLELAPRIVDVYDSVLQDLSLVGLKPGRSQ